MISDLFSMMARNLTYLLLFVLLCSGCVTSERIVVGDSNQFDAINIEAKSKPAKVILLNGDVYLAAALHVAEDSTRFTGRRVSGIDEWKKTVFATDQIKRIRLQERTPRVGTGMILGLAIAFPTGYTIWQESTDCRVAGGTILGSCASDAMFLGGLFSVVGTAVGAIVGSRRAHARVFTFNNDSERKEP